MQRTWNKKRQKQQQQQTHHRIAHAQHPQKSIQYKEHDQCNVITKHLKHYVKLHIHAILLRRFFV